MATGEIHKASVDALVGQIQIPPRPSLLQDLQAEMAKADPDPHKIAGIAAQDVALTAAVLKVVNSPLYGLSRRVDSISQAVALLGLTSITTLVTGLVARQAIKSDGPSMVRFWDVSTKRAMVLRYLARKLRIGSVDVAQTFGLFCDLGIPLMMQKFSDYIDVLQVANNCLDRPFTAVESAKYKTDHALVGAVMARTWGLSPEIAVAIRMHHDHTVYERAAVMETAKDLVAMGVLAEKIIQDYTGQNHTVEWQQGGAAALRHLMLSEHDFDELKDDMHEAFAND